MALGHIDVQRTPCIELIYEEREASGRIKDYMESPLKMGTSSKLFKKIEEVYDKLLIIGEEIVSIAPQLKTM